MCEKCFVLTLAQTTGVTPDLNVLSEPKCLFIVVKLRVLPKFMLRCNELASLQSWFKYAALRLLVKIQNTGGHT